MPVTLKPLNELMAPAGAPVPAENALDPGETIVPSDVADVMGQILSLSKEVDSMSVPRVDVDSGTASLIIGAILIYFLIKIVFRFLPIILGVSAIILFIKAYGSA